jgi:predicted RNA-binding Zn ribbon-like protein
MVRESNELILRWPNGPAFTFDAGAVCLELLTTGGAANYPWYELFHAPEDLATWLATCRLRIDARVTGADVPAACRLREAIWAATLARIDGRPLPRPSIATINELAAPAPPIPLLHGEERQWASAATGAQALSAIARDTIDLFGSPYAARIRECASNNCSLVFVDLSRPGQRRWCSMERCGNRAKQRARHARDSTG